MRMPRLPHLYEDVFSGEVGGAFPVATTELRDLEGTTLVAGDGEFLGNVNFNHYDGNSIVNQFGPYGSRYSGTSIFNQYGRYGGPYGECSPFNQYSQRPPRFFKGSQPIGFLTVNEYLSPRVDPQVFMAWLAGHS